MIHEKIQTLLDCVCVALEEAERPVCSCYMTIGPPVVGLCCECGSSGESGALTAHFETIYDVDPSSLTRITPRIASCRVGARAIDVVFTLQRCYPAIDERGNLPDPEEFTDAATLLHRDVEALNKAIRCCGERVLFRDTAVDSMPSGGCSALMARVTIGL